MPWESGVGPMDLMTRRIRAGKKLLPLPPTREAVVNVAVPTPVCATAFAYETTIVLPLAAQLPVTVMF